MNVQKNWYPQEDLKSKLADSDLSYSKLSPLERMEKFFNDHNPKDILITSSFGSSSAIILHMISKVNPDQPIHFIDTSYHFEETVKYKDQLAEQLNLNIVEVKAKPNKNRFTDQNKTYLQNQDLCCFINKVEPLNEIKAQHKFWVSGLMAHQNANRKDLSIFEQKNEIIKFYPILDMTAEEVELYKLIYELPSHPLVKKGYDSIGCSHCTQKGTGRDGRWANLNKTECGLHA
ncbi:phosphoadenylyl-sulfate reductase [Fulvivirga maritima]|uniref:phosphoadenylyl-sulfate reductase n=1 Tax=Fulvivirga maritima TaxID=2904247 RepID=UPI001F1C78CA|nr:phosphoadenylyl-sulfate reductase [Fulvivirga maritima]UII29162.1 phosphoadenylyl-sulfate reductase [Fulvivirga maritima]